MVGRDVIIDMDGGAVELGRGRLPDTPELARGDRPYQGHPECWTPPDAVVVSPYSLGALSSDATMIVFGDSYAGDLVPPLAIVAEHRGWKLLVLARGGCPPTDIEVYPAELNAASTV